MAQQTDGDGDPLPLDAADFPPGLQWEQGVYDIYQLVRTQWQYTMAGRACLQYDRAEKLAEARGYDLELFIDLLRSIEYAEMMHDADEREAAKAKNG